MTTPQPLDRQDPQHQAAVLNAITQTSPDKRKHQGLPPFEDDGPPLSFYEFWPTKLFYIPIVACWIWLGLRFWGMTLPTVANPGFPLGGLVGESKEAVFKAANLDALDPWIARFFAFDKHGDDVAALHQQALAGMEQAGLTFPLVAKPDVGCRGVGVQLVRDEAALMAYIQTYPAGGRIMLQELVPYEAEAGVFYIRDPDADKGFIFSLTLKYNPYVIGDGVSTLRELIRRDRRAGRIAHVYHERHRDLLDTVIPAGQNFRLAFTGSHSRGTIFRNGNAYITEAMTEAFDTISKTIPEFYVGRFDCRFPSIEDLQAGRHFMIVEINGSGGEATHIWDRKTSIWEAYRVLFAQYWWLFRVGFANRRRGVEPCSLWALWRAYRMERRLTKAYPFTE